MVAICWTWISSNIIRIRPKNGRKWFEGCDWCSRWLNDSDQILHTSHWCGDIFLWSHIGQGIWTMSDRCNHLQFCGGPCQISEVWWRADIISFFAQWERYGTTTAWLQGAALTSRSIASTDQCTTPTDRYITPTSWHITLTSWCVAPTSLAYDCC